MWVHVLVDMHRKALLDLFKPKQSASVLWQGIVKVVLILAKGVWSLVVNGRDTAFWLDTWFMKEPLSKWPLKEISLMELYKKVSDYWNSTSRWN